MICPSAWSVVWMPGGRLAGRSVRVFILTIKMLNKRIASSPCVHADKQLPDYPKQLPKAWVLIWWRIFLYTYIQRSPHYCEDEEEENIQEPTNDKWKLIFHANSGQRRANDQPQCGETHYPIKHNHHQKATSQRLAFGLGHVTSSIPARERRRGGQYQMTRW